MSGLFNSAWVIARRDFVATVWSKTFLLFLLAPIVTIGFGILIAEIAGRGDRQAQRPTLAIIMDYSDASAVSDAHTRLARAMSPLDLPRITPIKPEPNIRAQAQRLLSGRDSNITAVLMGTLDRPILIGPSTATHSLGRSLSIILEDARRAQAMRGAGIEAERPEIRTVATAKSSGSVKMVRHLLARVGQGTIFILTLLLAGMLLSNLVEEKSNKVIEVLAAAVPLDAVFLGKLVAMLGVSLVGILVWGSLAGIGLFSVRDLLVPITPAVGWPIYAFLLVLYFTANYMLLGSVFLGIGGQASNVREVQTLSMPITFAQVMIFALASAVVGDKGGTMTLVAAIFPLSSPMAMLAIAAQSETLWWHAAALLWQLIWVALIIRLSARMFRLTVLKSASRDGFFSVFRRKASRQPSA